jgi:hypothetical protein
MQQIHGRSTMNNPGRYRVGMSLLCGLAPDTFDARTLLYDVRSLVRGQMQARRSTEDNVATEREGLRFQRLCGEV